MAEAKKFRSYVELFDFYLRQHSHTGNRRMHAIGKVLGIAVLATSGHPLDRSSAISGCRV
ncbi:MAG TPA: Mpo1-like protein [Terriglobales bacterium]|nr:Mpo1-like protein [Terriglobales bacterium]